MNSEKPEIAKEDTSNEHDSQAVHAMLACVRQETSPANKFDPGGVIEKIYAQGKSGDDWVAARSFSKNPDANPPGGVGLYELKMDGKLYIDFIQPNNTSAPGQDTVAWIDQPEKIGDHGHPLTKGSAEYNKVIKQIHSQNLFDGCEELP